MNKKKTSVNTSRLKRILLGAGLVIALLVSAGAVSVLTYGMVDKAVVSQASGGNQIQPDIQGPQETPVLDESGKPIPVTPNPMAPASEPTLTPWDGASRVTVLLLGLDYRDWSQDENGPSRSDTMILLTLDPQTHTAGMLSIPRDMWVSIPGFKHGKINTAYYLGDAYKLPGGGPGLAVKTVEQFLGVPINYYAQIDFGAFVSFIDEIGGVKIDVPEKITIDLLGDNNTKTLKPGVQVLPGEWALAYARARHTEGGDFDRAKRQQQVILGIRDRVISFDMLPTLIKKAPVLYQQLSSGIHTNLTLDDAIRLALLAQSIPDENIKRGVLDEKYVQFGWSPDHLSILIPMPDKVHTLRDEIFATSGALSPMTKGDPAEKMKAEGASLAIYNGSRDPELAKRSAIYLESQGAHVVEVGEAGQRYALTTVIDHSGNPYMLKYLVEYYGIHEFKVVLDYQPDNPINVELYLGYDAEGKGG